MSKKQKSKKKLYKRWWFWLLVVIVIVAIGSGMENKKSDNNKSNSTSTTKNENKKDNNNITRNKYDKITMGESKAELIKSLGKPNVSTATNVEGQKAESLSWNNLSKDFKAGLVTTTIVDNKVNGKSYVNISPTKIKPIDKNKLNSIQDGESYNEVVSKLGKPDSETYSNIGGISTIMIDYSTNKNGDAQSFTFINNSLTSKTETHLN